jgi:hypothetical protein
MKITVTENNVIQLEEVFTSIVLKTAAGEKIMKTKTYKTISDNETAFNRKLNELVVNGYVTEGNMCVTAPHGSAVFSILVSKQI